MKGMSYNEGEYPARVIVDRDTINDLQIDAGATVKLGMPGDTH